MNPRDCCSQVASIDPGAMGIPYRGLGLITLSERPMTPHYCMRRPGAGGRSNTSVEPCVRGRYRALLGRHDLPRRDGRHITSAPAAGTGQ